MGSNGRVRLEGFSPSKPEPEPILCFFPFFTIIVSLNILVGPNKPYFSLFKAKVLHFHSFSNPSKPRTQRRLLHTTLSLFVHFFHSLVHISSPSFFQSMRISLSRSLSQFIFVFVGIISFIDLLFLYFVFHFDLCSLTFFFLVVKLFLFDLWCIDSLFVLLNSLCFSCIFYIDLRFMSSVYF
jgi:hypothetical protein